MGRLLFMSTVAVVTTFALCAMAVGAMAYARHPISGGAAVSASTDLKSTRGKVVYSDNFHDTSKQWAPLTDTGDSTWTSSAGGYEIVASGFHVYSRKPPHSIRLRQLSMSLTASQSRDTPPDAGFGVGCWRGDGDALIQYDLVVTGEKFWVLRRDGASGSASTSYALKFGSTRVVAGPIPIMVVGVCATLADGVTTRLALFVNGSIVADLMDVAGLLPGQGWAPSVLVASSAVAPSRVTFTGFEERNLAA